MKSIVILFAAALLATAAQAKKHSGKKAGAAKSRTAVNKKVESAAQVRALDLNTRMWLESIRIKVYGFDPNRKPGQKGGC